SSPSGAASARCSGGHPADQRLAAGPLQRRATQRGRRHHAARSGAAPVPDRLAAAATQPEEVDVIRRRESTKACATTATLISLTATCLCVTRGAVAAEAP